MSFLVYGYRINNKFSFLSLFIHSERFSPFQNSSVLTFFTWYQSLHQWHPPLPLRISPPFLHQLLNWWTLLSLLIETRLSCQTRSIQLHSLALSGGSCNSRLRSWILRPRKETSSSWIGASHQWERWNGDYRESRIFSLDSWRSITPQLAPIVPVCSDSQSGDHEQNKQWSVVSLGESVLFPLRSSDDAAPHLITKHQERINEFQCMLLRWRAFQTLILAGCKISEDDLFMNI